jgi:hypothetical protein
LLIAFGCVVWRWISRSRKPRSVAYRTWRRLETEGKASIEYLVKAAIALRCEEALEGLFPAPVATSLDDLLKREAKGAGVASPRRSRAKGRGGSPS